MDDPSRQLLTHTGASAASSGGACPHHLCKRVIIGDVKRFSSSPLLVDGLKNNTWYQLRVGAGNLAGDGPLSNPCAPVRTLALPAPVTGLRISVMTPTLTRLAWNCLDECAKEATFFDVRYFPVSLDLRQLAGPRSSSSGQMLVNATASHTAYSVDLHLDIANLTSSSGIILHIYAGSRQGQEDKGTTMTKEDKGTTITLPSAASHLRVTSSTEYALSFAWQPHPAADTFQVLFARPLEEGEDPDTAPPFRPAAPETALSTLTVAGLLTAVDYRFKVVSKVKGVTPFDLLGSNILQAAPSGLPFKPLSVRVTASWSSQVSLAWQPSPQGPHPQRYRVEFARVDAAGNAIETYGRPVETVLTSTTITGLGSILQGQGDNPSGVALQFRVYAGSHKEFEVEGTLVDLPLVSAIGQSRALQVRGSSEVPTLGAVAISLQWLPPPGAWPYVQALHMNAAC
jgi:hypothetical protein